MLKSLILTASSIIILLQTGKNGFGFILCCENETTDTFVLHVLKNSPASKASLIPGDRIIEVSKTEKQKYLFKPNKDREAKSVYCRFSSPTFCAID